MCVCVHMCIQVHAFVQGSSESPGCCHCKSLNVLISSFFNNHETCCCAIFTIIPSGNNENPGFDNNKLFSECRICYAVLLNAALIHAQIQET